MKTFLVAGLGNPEGKYFNTYHNVGFLAAEKLANVLGCAFIKKGNMLITEAFVEKTKVIIIKPLTYMNRSGEAVAAVVRKLKIPSENIIVIHDDIYIDSGNIRVSFGGSSGGQKGAGSIIDILGTKDFFRVRIGIKPDKPVVFTNYVLSKVKDAGLLGVNDAADATMLIVNGVTLQDVQQKYNKTNQ